MYFEVVNFWVQEFVVELVRLVRVNLECFTFDNISFVKRIKTIQNSV